MVLASGRSGRTFVLPETSAREAALARDVRVLTANTLLEVCAHLGGQALLKECVAISGVDKETDTYPDLADVRGQAQAKRALEIAAAGGHSILILCTSKPKLIKPVVGTDVHNILGVCPFKL